VSDTTDTTEAAAAEALPKGKTAKKGGPTPRRPRQRQKERQLGELKFSAMVAPPDGERDPDTGKPIPQRVDVDLRAFTLAERQLVKQVMAKFAAPIDLEDVIVAHAWVIWRRTHPTSSLQFWMEHITFGDMLDSLVLEPDHVVWDTTPDDYDPLPSSTT